jgi:hypothetical protein
VPTSLASWWPTSLIRGVFPQELQKIVPQLPSLPVQPIILESQEPWGKFPHFERYPWVLPPHSYTSLEQLMQALPEHVIAPAMRKVEELRVAAPR